MKALSWIFAGVLGLFVITGGPVMAQDNGNGHGNGHGKGHEKHGDDDDRDEHYYKHNE
jgi:hypothetical protein